MDLSIRNVHKRDMSRSDDWYQTPQGEPRGFIESRKLEEVWFHTGTACNLACPFCLESSKPGDNRLQQIRFADVEPFIHEALTLGVQQFSFTGGEPFVNKDFVRILATALSYRPCLVLTNATTPLIKRLHQLAPLLKQPHSLHFRVSLDHFDEVQHDAGRGQGMFKLALEGMRHLYGMGFTVSIAHQTIANCDTATVARCFEEVLTAHGLPGNLHRIEFPEFHSPASQVSVPVITPHCMNTYQTEQTRQRFMCAFSRMVVKQAERMRVYACTLVDDDPDYALADTLTDSLAIPVSLKHHRCYSCFRYGASCSEYRSPASVTIP
ncbi:MAG TPA: radical SAM protein [Nitrosomonas sp.]|nr:radical SAM protein [Nitrosomonas sp.]HNJ90999.1 radical SAM protein [Nitrosomonas sp.]HNK88844.1 radical SAM protein [Nitrosomonas sp.]